MSGLALSGDQTEFETIEAKISLHADTVASGLSRPFRPDPTADGLFSPEESAAHLLRVLNGFGADDTGGVFAWNGSPIAV